ncbi:LigT [Cryptosporidium canis]|uniref:LigT n=1 Tax=Cryptosporidium canis TaxID=195482 RepID=A0A9D5DIL0_9CRYT|nr:LigT [Cryptosporidium canis]
MESVEEIKERRSRSSGGSVAQSVEGEGAEGGLAGCQFHSDQVKGLDESILFPPTNYVELRGPGFQRPDDHVWGRTVVEYVDLRQIPARLMGRLSQYRPTEDIRVRRDDGSSDSWSEGSEEEPGLVPGFDDSDLAQDLCDSSSNIRVNQSPTHFFSLAFNRHSTNLIREFNALKRVVIDSAEYDDIRPSYFIGDKKLHITLGLVRVETPQELSQCESALLELRESQEYRDILEESSSQKGLLLGLSGLGYFGSSQNSRVVYAKISEVHKVALIKRLWFRLSEILIAHGVSITVPSPTPEHPPTSQNPAEAVLQNYTPHVTFINTKYGSRSEKPRLTFDSSKLVRSYSKKNFGPGYISEIQFNELSGSQQTRLNSTPEEVYKTVFSIKMDSNQ